MTSFTIFCHQVLYMWVYFWLAGGSSTTFCLQCAITECHIATWQVFNRREQLGLRTKRKDANAHKKLKRRRAGKSSRRLARLRRQSKSFTSSEPREEHPDEAEADEDQGKKIAKAPKAKDKTAKPKAKAKAKAKATAKAGRAPTAKAKAKAACKPKAKAKGKAKAACKPKAKAKGKAAAKAKSRSKKDAAAEESCHEASASDAVPRPRRRATTGGDADPQLVDHLASWALSFDEAKISKSKEAFKAELRYWLPVYTLCYLDIYWSRYSCGVCFKSDSGTKNFCGYFSFGKTNFAMLLSVKAALCLATCCVSLVRFR